MDATLLGALIPAAVTLGGILVTVFGKRKTARTAAARALADHTVERETKSYDNLQQDLEQLRAEFRQYKIDEEKEKERLRAELWRHRQQQAEDSRLLEADRDRWREIAQLMDEEVVEIRHGIQTGTIPPLPTRRPWPEPRRKPETA